MMVETLWGANLNQEGIPITKGINTGDSENVKTDYEITFLFEVKGISVFRFRDKDYYRYFTIGDGSFLPYKQNTGGKWPSYWIDGADTVKTTHEQARR